MEVDGSESSSDQSEKSPSLIIQIKYITQVTTTVIMTDCAYRGRSSGMTRHMSQSSLGSERECGFVSRSGRQGRFGSRRRREGLYISSNEREGMFGCRNGR